MPKAEPAARDALSLALTAAAHPVRRDILGRLGAEPLSVGALAEAYDMSLPAISRHLKLLERARLIERQVSGRVHLIVPRPEGLARIREWTAAQTAGWTARLTTLKTLMEDGDG